MADKVRYYLEQSVPELEDLQNKGLFDKNEITKIMRRRTDFEHRISGRGSKPSDFLRYCQYENNVEKLRKKRYNRLNSVGLIDLKPSISDWAGIRRIMFILDRATKKFPNDLELWNQYLKYAKENGAIKIIYKVYSSLLQLQPRNINAWLSACKYEFEINGNAKGTRILFQRALRINPDNLELWLNYCQFELTYVSKILARRKILSKEINEEDAAELTLPSEEHELDLPEVDIDMLGNPETNPALKGDVALAIFDAAPKTIDVIYKFIELFDKFPDLNDYLNSHVLRYLQREYPDDINTKFIDITLPLKDGEFQLSVNKFIAYQSKNSDKELKNMFIKKLKDYQNEDNQVLLNAIIKKLI
ncbi:unnamed protein product [Candida verbasci]|uniref:U3 small nucleolar RNA-associated protein 6 N-terminal domain-containing protein n=1 Tax=Candida verbasci TaxID=1227364 RepID=A0A9W4TRK6_9ASCO|nr:unnamed protein product [Candida verbasci]